MAFGREYRFTPDSSIFEYRNVKLPQETILTDIVSYTDYVQLRAVVREIQLLGERPVFVDVGAFHGAYAVVLGKVIQEKGGKVIAIEPNPGEFRILEDNVRLNGLEETVVCERVAVADFDGDARLQLAGNQTVLRPDETAAGVRTEVATLASLLKKHCIDAVDILMIDVEGAELPVLRGFPWGAMRIPKIYCEMHPFAWDDFGYTGRDIGQFIRERGYRCFDMFFQEHIEFREELFYIGPTLLFPSRGRHEEKHL